MPQFDPRGGFSGAVDVRAPHPGWSPFFTQEERQQAERDAEAQQKYLSAEGKRLSERYAIRRPAAPEPFTPKRPVGEIDEARLAGIVAAITHERGLHLDREKAVAYGREKFAELILAGHECRRIVPLQVELTSFGQLANWLSNLFPSPVPPLGLGEQLRGERFPEAARITSLDDIWKCPPDPLLHQLYAHWQAFRSLVFGQSLLDAGDGSGCVRSLFWSSGLHDAASEDRRLDLLGDWKSFVIPPPGKG